MRSSIISLAFLFSSIPNLDAAPAGVPTTRTITQFTSGWRFLIGDPPGAQATEFPDAQWTSLTLPHDWAIAGPVKEDAPTRAAGGFFPSGVGWYRKTFDSNPAPHRETFIVFDGVMANSDVYLNGHLLGHSVIPRQISVLATLVAVLLTRCAVRLFYLTGITELESLPGMIRAVHGHVVAVMGQRVI